MTKSTPSLKHTPARKPPPSAQEPTQADHDPDDDHVLFMEANGVPRLLATAMLDEALTLRQRRSIGKPAGVAMVVEVAQPEMFEAVHEALRVAGAFVEIYRRDGSQKSSHKPENGSDKVAHYLGRGYNVAGISQAADRYLPATLTAAADIRIRLAIPSTRAVREVIRIATGKRVRSLPALAGLSFLDICSAIRGNGSARDAVRRLTAMTAARRAAAPAAAATHLRDTYGYGEAQTWGLSLAHAVEEWRDGRRGWASIPNRNILLGGPPGCGKTQFAVTLAASLGLPLVTTSVAAWFTSGGGYLNDVIRAIDTVFAEANAAGPCVLLLDELDAAPNRETVDARHRDFWTPVVTALLLALDGATSNAANLVVVGATNHPSRLDPALVRPGRLNKVIHIGLPDAEAVVGILRQHLRDDLPGADLAPIGVLGAGSSGAEIASWAKTARGAALAAGRAMTLADLVDVVAPPETRAPELVAAIASHEAAHAVVTEVLGVGDLDCVTLVQKGGMGGYSSARLRNQSAMTGHQVDDLVVSLLAGRAIDEILGDATSGAGGQGHSDLAIATRLVASKLGSWGLGGNLLYLGNADEVADLCRLDRPLREAVAKELDRLHLRALGAVREHGRRIDCVARRLLQARVLSGAEVRSILETIPADVVPTQPSPNTGAPHA